MPDRLQGYMALTAFGALTFTSPLACRRINSRRPSFVSLEGEPLRVVSHKVDMRGWSVRWLIERLDARHSYYLSGEMIVGSKLERVRDLDLYRPADFDGKVLRPHYAQAEEFGPYLGLVAVQGEVYVQFGSGLGIHRWMCRSGRMGRRA